MTNAYPYNIGPQTVTIYSPEGIVSGVRSPSVLEAIKAGDFAEAIKLLSPIQTIAGAFAQFADVTVTANAVLFKGREVNNASAMRLLELQALGMPLESEVRCLASLMRHDDARVIASFEDFIQRWNIPRVSDGRIVLCKGVRADFRDGHTGTVDWSVGQTVRLPWEKADRDPNNTCSRGLHAAPLEGARSYASRDGHLIEVYVWPEHIAALPYDYQHNGKIRCVEAFVSRVIPREQAEQYYDFAPLVYDAPEDESEAFNAAD